MTSPASKIPPFVKTTRLTLLVGACLLVCSPTAHALSPSALTARSITEETQAAHNLRSRRTQEGIDYSEYARLLEKYVAPTGVRYAAWFADEADLRALEDFLEYAAGVDLSEHSKEAQAAFYINLYNAAMLQSVFEHYPLDSVKDIGLLPFSIFKRDFIRQGGRSLSLDAIEKQILLKDHFDPRIHFAVNCASESCPPLLDEPYVAKRLDAQLDAQTRAFAQSARAARVLMGQKRIAYYELFKWYADDFGVDNPAEYLNRYREMPLPLDYETDWIDYDWSLNAALN